MKKITAVLLCLCLSAWMLAACGSGESAEVKSSADKFLSAMKSGDTAGIRQYSTENAISDEDLAIFDSEAFESTLYESIGIPKEELDADLQAQITSLCDKYSKDLIKEYSIKSAEVKDGVGTVNVDITYGFDIDTLFEGEEQDAAMDELIASYQEEHEAELLSLYLTDGEEAMYKKLFTDIMPDVIKLLNDELDSSKEVSEDLYLTLEKIDGTWKVTDSYTYEP